MAPPKPAFLAGSGGIFIDMGIHDFDAARWLVGDVTRVSAYGTALSDPGFVEIGDFDTAVVVLTFANGALGVLDISRVAGYGYDSSAELMGSRATVRIEEPFLHGYEWRTPGTASRPLVQTFDRRYAAAFVAELERLRPLHHRRHPAPGHGGRRVGRLRPGPGGTQACRLGRSVTPRRAVVDGAGIDPAGGDGAGIDGGAASDGVAGSGGSGMTSDLGAYRGSGGGPSGQAIADPGPGERDRPVKAPPGGVIDRLAGAPSRGESARCRGGASCCPGTGCCRKCTSSVSKRVSSGRSGYLGDDPGEIRALLSSFSLGAVGGFVPVALHDPGVRQQAQRDAEQAAQLLAGRAAPTS